ncbi:glycoside hydrolase family 108 protein [Sphingobium scionense]|uniref:Lysozyme family protein n=1 Tax=Sphingobium scionense TaxID=1404341 RepID=A0A7W6LPB2_9SPHN|nr:N-acetylmuramidase [Sphingobium scionense]MBB4148014.1 lysozyme family protein [Sphingobium scionense]
MATINAIIEDVLANEGGYVNDPRDAGGETNFGITIATARANGFTGPMKAITRDFARGVYVKQYVEAPGFDKIAAISPSIGAELVDTGVNMGPKVAAQFLQRALNGLNNQGKDYADLLVDGSAGQKTRDALTAFLKKRGAEGERRLLLLLNALQGERYLSLCEGRAANEAFLFGWLARIAA